MKRVGILGLAHGHVFSFGSEWAQNPAYDVEIAGVWDRDETRLRDGATKLNTQAFADLDVLLQSDIDAVVITSETAFHAELAQKAACAGKDIILYKPMALTMRDADAIVEAVDKAGVRLSMGWQMRADPQNIEMKRLIESGELGNVCPFRRRHAPSTHLWQDFEHTWHNDPRLNRDIFADDSAHPFDLMLWLFGMPESVMCEMSTMVNPAVPNDNAVAVFRYANGLICEISLCFTCCAAEITTEAYLTGGSIQQYYGDNPACRLPKPEGVKGLKWYREGDADWTFSPIPSPAAHGERLKAQAAPLAAFLHGAPPLATAKEGRDCLRLVLSCYLSAREGKRVTIGDERVYEV